MSEYSIRTMLNDIDIDPPQKLSIKYPKIYLILNSTYTLRLDGAVVWIESSRYGGNVLR